MRFRAPIHALRASRFRFFQLAFLLVVFCIPLLSGAQSEAPADTAPMVMPTVAPVTTLVATDQKYDNGDAIGLSWVPSIDDQPEVGSVTGYQVFRSVNGGPFTSIVTLLPGQNQYIDDKI